ncbi:MULTISPECIES: hypothetical protein [unclassified Granulicatella]|uniref:hypothetical protein n=1 Tax=unclassified Granulicatella TaxID=2630493 RepID=UPI00107430D8|nr:MULTISPECIES: hypothetical protein [unclassified Granulicatella]MBF0779644.1 hypothetical protein [Granulicatella sp. 19428wC4_WM01]TFU96302.1 hypothetical protein E4T68_00930 [Granulicatella sp. WM01]
MLYVISVLLIELMFDRVPHIERGTVRGIVQFTVSIMLYVISVLLIELMFNGVPHTERGTVRGMVQFTVSIMLYVISVLLIELMFDRMPHIERGTVRGMVQFTVSTRLSVEVLFNGVFYVNRVLVLDMVMRKEICSFGRGQNGVTSCFKDSNKK